MTSRRLGLTGRSVPGIGLGGYSFKEAAHRDRHTAVIRRALDLGATLIDTAPGYGDSEETIGLALAGVPRDAYQLSTKYYPYGEGDRLNPSDTDFDRSLTRSLERLRTDHVDLLHLHWVHGPEDIRRILSSPLAGALRRAQAAGRVRLLAVSEASEMDGEHWMLETAMSLRFFDAVMVTYNVFLQTAARGVLPLAARDGVGVLVMMPLNQAENGSGLTGPAGAAENVRRLAAAGALPADPAFMEPGLMDFLTSGTRLSVPQAALRFVLDHDAVSCALVGTANPDHFAESAAANDAPPLPKATHARAHALFGKVTRHIK